MTREGVLQKIEKELADAERARRTGNNGMVRVCARRAAGAAIAFWLQSNPRAGWGVDAMSQLQSLQMDTTLPQNIRDAAMRLTTRITHQFTSPFSADPAGDSREIIHHLLGEHHI